MKSFELRILDAEQVVFQGPALYCGIMTAEGSHGLEANHEPFMGVLSRDSKLSWESPGGKETKVTVQGGLVTFKAGACTILADLAKA